MAPLHHPNLIRLWGAVWNEGPDKLCIVLEYVSGGTLLEALKPGNEVTWNSLGYKFAYGIAKCFEYLHHEQPSPILHRQVTASLRTE